MELIQQNMHLSNRNVLEDLFSDNLFPCVPKTRHPQSHIWTMWLNLWVQSINKGRWPSGSHFSEFGIWWEKHKLALWTGHEAAEDHKQADSERLGVKRRSDKRSGCTDRGGNRAGGDQGYWFLGPCLLWAQASFPALWFYETLQYFSNKSLLFAYACLK